MPLAPSTELLALRSPLGWGQRSGRAAPGEGTASLSRSPGALTVAAVPRSAAAAARLAWLLASCSRFHFRSSGGFQFRYERHGWEHLPPPLQRCLCSSAFADHLPFAPLPFVFCLLLHRAAPSVYFIGCSLLKSPAQ